ncbi:MAG: CcdB family protein [Rhodocyclaceae bacterium]|nr:CcdB family protein [Rhodocyclaceae bacterium]
MARLDVYANPDRGSARRYPYLLDVQADLLRDLPSTVIIPLAKPEVVEGKPILRLNPTLEVKGKALLAMTQELAAYPRKSLGEPVENLGDERAVVLAALDLLFTGL